jgi:hypothetical protein
MSGASDEGIGWNGGDDAVCHAEYVSPLAAYRERLLNLFRYVDGHKPTPH